MFFFCQFQQIFCRKKTLNRNCESEWQIDLAHLGLALFPFKSLTFSRGPKGCHIDIANIFRSTKGWDQPSLQSPQNKSQKSRSWFVRRAWPFYALRKTSLKKTTDPLKKGSGEINKIDQKDHVRRKFLALGGWAPRTRKWLTMVMVVVPKTWCCSP